MDGLQQDLGERASRRRERRRERVTEPQHGLRSVPVLAETSVIVAAATGVPVARVFWATVLPNLIVAAIYSVAADDSLVTAAVTFLATMVLSYLVWRVFGRVRLSKAS